MCPLAGFNIDGTRNAVRPLRPPPGTEEQHQSKLQRAGKPKMQARGAELARPPRVEDPQCAVEAAGDHPALVRRGGSRHGHCRCGGQSHVFQNAPVQTLFNQKQETA